MDIITGLFLAAFAAFYLSLLVLILFRLVTGRRHG